MSRDAAISSEARTARTELTPWAKTAHEAARKKRRETTICTRVVAAERSSKRREKRPTRSFATRSCAAGTHCYALTQRCDPVTILNYLIKMPDYCNGTAVVADYYGCAKDTAEVYTVTTPCVGVEDTSCSLCGVCDNGVDDDGDGYYDGCDSGCGGLQCCRLVCRL